MLPLKKALKSKLKNKQKIVILGIGSDFRGDDASGLIAARIVLRRISRRKAAGRISAVFAESVPENITGLIRKIKPGYVIIIDSTHMGKKAGDFCLVEPSDIEKNLVSTHKVSLDVFARYLEQSIGCKMFIVGIQPKSIKFGSSVTKQVESAARKVAAALIELDKA